jgi:hypothetical protein
MKTFEKVLTAVMAIIVLTFKAILVGARNYGYSYETERVITTIFLFILVAFIVTMIVLEIKSRKE